VLGIDDYRDDIERDTEFLETGESTRRTTSNFVYSTSTRGAKTCYAKLSFYYWAYLNRPLVY
jgi:hypothetical protein